MANVILTHPTPEAQGDWTDARATSDVLLEDHEGILRAIPSGELPFEKARVVKNLIAGSSEDLTQRDVDTGDGTTTATQWTPDTANDKIYDNVTTVEGESYTISFKAKVVSGSSVGAKIRTGNSATANAIDITVTGTTQRFSATVLGRTGGGAVAFGFQASIGATYELTEWQVENVTGQTIQTPSEYVSVGAEANPNEVSILTNGTFDDTSAWSIANATISGGILTLQTGSNTYAYQAVMTLGQSYFVSVDYDITSYSGDFYIGENGGDFIDLSSLSGTGTVTGVITPTVSTWFVIRSTTGADATFDNVTCTPVKDGYGVYSTANANTVTSNVVTEATGSALSPVPYLRHVPSATNLVTFPIEFDNAAWTKSNTTITANDAIAPDGSYTSDLAIPSATSSSKYLLQDASVTDTVYYTQTIYAKSGGYDFLQISTSSGFTSNRYVNFNLSTGTIDTESWDSHPRSIEQLDNGWCRCSVTRPATSTTSGRFLITPLNTNTASRLPIYTGDGTSGVYLWGAQLEATVFATPPIIDGTLRNATAIQQPLELGTNFVQSEGAMTFDFSSNYDGADARVGMLSLNGTDREVFHIGTSVVKSRGIDAIDSAATGSVANSSDTFRFGIRWSMSLDELQVGLYNVTNPSGWAWDLTPSTHSGFNANTLIQLCVGNTHLVNIHAITLQDTVATTAEIEAGLPSGAAAAVLTAVTQGYTLGDAAVGVLATRELPITSDSYSVGSTDVGTLVAREMPLDTTSVNLGSATLDLSRGYTISLSTAGWSLTGIDSGLTTERTLPITGDSWNLVGTDAVLLSGQDYDLVLDTGSYSLVLSAAGLTKGYAVDENGEFKRLIDTDGDYKYVGETSPGIPTSEPYWRLKRIEFLAGDDIEIRWAEDDNFTHIWDNRLTETYN